MAGSVAETRRRKLYTIGHCGAQVHFGMSGAFKALSLPGREATPTTRLTLVNHDLNLVAHLSAMTVAHGDLGAQRRASEPTATWDQENGPLAVVQYACRSAEPTSV